MMEATIVIDGRKYTGELVEENEYPKYFRSKLEGKVIKFLELTEGTVVWQGDSIDEKGYYLNGWTEHTNTTVWKEVAYNKERDLFDGQPVECWYDGENYATVNGFYDAVNDRIFSFEGKRDGVFYYKYKAIPYEKLSDRMLKAYKTLEV